MMDSILSLYIIAIQQNWLFCVTNLGDIIGYVKRQFEFENKNGCSYSVFSF